MLSMAEGIRVETVEGDIARQGDMDAVVNAANAWLKTGGGVAGALHRAAGPGLEEEGRSLAPIKPGDAVITKGYDLPNCHVIHCLGPVYGIDKPADVLLSSCYRNALLLAEKYEIESIAFPSISTGVFGYPIEEAAKIAFATIKEMALKLNRVKKIRFVLHGSEALAAFEQVQEEILNCIDC